MWVIVWRGTSPKLAVCKLQARLPTQFCFLSYLDLKYKPILASVRFWHRKSWIFTPAKPLYLRPRALPSPLWSTPQMLAGGEWQYCTREDSENSALTHQHPGPSNPMVQDLQPVSRVQGWSQWWRTISAKQPSFVLRNNEKLWYKKGIRRTNIKPTASCISNCVQCSWSSPPASIWNTLIWLLKCCSDYKSQTLRRLENHFVQFPCATLSQAWQTEELSTNGTEVACTKLVTGVFT